jgi:hypothetical protein
MKEGTRHLLGERVEEMLEQARTFLAAAREFLSKEDQPSLREPADSENP